MFVVMKDHVSDSAAFLLVSVAQRNRRHRAGGLSSVGEKQKITAHVH